VNITVAGGTNCNVHETLTLTMDQATETTRKSLSTFKKKETYPWTSQKYIEKCNCWVHTYRATEMLPCI